MRTLAIAIGNPLRCDDGVAHRLAASLRGCEIQSVLQLTPELAETIAAYAQVIFIDADAEAKQMCIEPVAELTGNPPLTHVSTSSETVALARALYGFSGQAFLCSIPAHDFSAGEGLSAEAELASEAAAAMINALAKVRS